MKAVAKIAVMLAPLTLTCQAQSHNPSPDEIRQVTETTKAMALSMARPIARAKACNHHQLASIELDKAVKGFRLSERLTHVPLPDAEQWLQTAIEVHQTEFSQLHPTKLAQECEISGILQEKELEAMELQNRRERERLRMR